MSLDIDRYLTKKVTHFCRQTTKSEREQTCQKMKKALIDGQEIKVVCYDSGYGLEHGMRFFKRMTGKTMKQFREENRNKPQ